MPARFLECRRKRIWFIFLECTRERIWIIFSDSECTRERIRFIFRAWQEVPNPVSKRQRDGLEFGHQSELPRNLFRLELGMSKLSFPNHMEIPTWFRNLEKIGKFFRFGKPVRAGLD